MRLPSTLVAAKCLSGHRMADNRLTKEKIWGDFSYSNVRDAAALRVSMWIASSSWECGESCVRCVTAIVIGLIIWLSHFLSWPGHCQFTHYALTRSRLNTSWSIYQLHKRWPGTGCVKRRLFRLSEEQPVLSKKTAL